MTVFNATKATMSQMVKTVCFIFYYNVKIAKEKRCKYGKHCKVEHKLIIRNINCFFFFFLSRMVGAPGGQSERGNWD